MRALLPPPRPARSTRTPPRARGRLMRALLAPVVLAVVVALSTAQAAHCTTWRTSTTSDRMLVVQDPSGFFGEPSWFVTDLCQIEGVRPPTSEDAIAGVERLLADPFGPVDPLFGGGYGEDEEDEEGGSCLFSIWIYYESNGIDGLQRHDAQVDDTCHGMIQGDHFVW